MSYFYFICLKCNEETEFCGEPSELTEFVCANCKARHVQVGRIWGMHYCHSFPIWQLEGTEKISIGRMDACFMAPDSDVKIEWLIKDKKLISKYMKKITGEERMGK